MKRCGTAGEVELNMAAMLDMAFQLLTFFVLTFRPGPQSGAAQFRALARRVSGYSGLSVAAGLSALSARSTVTTPKADRRRLSWWPKMPTIGEPSPPRSTSRP